MTRTRCGVTVRVLEASKSSGRLVRFENGLHRTSVHAHPIPRNAFQINSRGGPPSRLVQIVILSCSITHHNVLHGHVRLIFETHVSHPTTSSSSTSTLGGLRFETRPRCPPPKMIYVPSGAKQKPLGFTYGSANDSGASCMQCTKFRSDAKHF